MWLSMEGFLQTVPLLMVVTLMFLNWGFYNFKEDVYDMSASFLLGVCTTFFITSTPLSPARGEGEIQWFGLLAAVLGSGQILYYWWWDHIGPHPIQDRMNKKENDRLERLAREHRDEIPNN